MYFSGGLLFYPDIPRKEPNMMYKIMRAIYKPISVIYPNIGLSSTHLVKAMVHIGINGGTKTIYENEDIRRITF